MNFQFNFFENRKIMLKNCSISLLFSFERKDLFVLKLQRYRDECCERNWMTCFNFHRISIFFSLKINYEKIFIFPIFSKVSWNLKIPAITYNSLSKSVSRISPIVLTEEERLFTIDKWKLEDVTRLIKICTKVDENSWNRLKYKFYNTYLYLTCSMFINKHCNKKILNISFNNNSSRSNLKWNEF